RAGPALDLAGQAAGGAVVATRLVERTHAMIAFAHRAGRAAADERGRGDRDRDKQTVHGAPGDGRTPVLRRAAGRARQHADIIAPASRRHRAGTVAPALAPQLGALAPAPGGHRAAVGCRRRTVGGVAARIALAARVARDRVAVGAAPVAGLAILGPVAQRPGV